MRFRAAPPARDSAPRRVRKRRANQMTNAKGNPHGFKAHKNNGGRKKATDIDIDLSAGDDVAEQQTQSAKGRKKGKHKKKGKPKRDSIDCPRRGPVSDQRVDWWVC